MSVHILRFTQSSAETIRLEAFLLRVLPGELARLMESPETSNSKIRRLIIAGAVSVNGSQDRLPASGVRKGSAVVVRLDTDKFSFEKRPDDIAFELTEERILFEDDMIIVVDKPANFPTESTVVASRDHLHAAVKRFLQRRDNTRNVPYVGLHHRLDRETSGVILFTKDRRANSAVHDMFLDHAARKEYEALTVSPAGAYSGGQGKRYRAGDAFSVENNIDRITAKSAAGKWGAVPAGGDPAHTDFRVLEAFDNGLRVLAMPLTGRTHQIRVHLAGLGLPLLGDSLYGGPEKLPGGYAIPRIMLHAGSLAFPHPVTGEKMTVTAPLPADFLACREALVR